LNKNLTDEYDFKYFVEEILPTFDEQFKTLSDDFVKSSTEKICAKYDSIKTEIYLEKESKNNQNGLESLNLLYENSTIIKAKKIIISNKELVDNENFPKLFISSSSTKIPSSNKILLEIKDLNTKYELEEIEELDHVKSLAKLLKDKKLLSNYARNNNTEARIKKILEWKSNGAKWNFSRSLSSISKAAIKDFDIELFLELKFENDNEIDKLKINCDKTSHLKIENKIKSLNKKQASTRDENFQDENIVLNPRFIWINFENLIQQKTINNIYNLLKNIVSTIDCDNFIVFFFIEKSKNETLENTEKFKESFNKLLKAIESNHKDIKNSIVINLIEEKNIEVVKIKNYMHLLAKFLNLEKFYSISEKIETFYEYNNTLIEFKSKTNSAVKALDFMAKVLSHSVYDLQEELSEVDLDNIQYFVQTLLRNKLIDETDHLFFKNSLLKYREDKNKENLATNFSLLKNLRNKLPNDLIQEYDDISNILQGKKIQYLSEIILAKKNKVKENELIQLNKTCELYFTHKHAKPEFNDIILYNTKAIDSLFPIQQQSADTTHKSDEQDLFFYKLLRNTASCYIVYFYTYETNYLEYKKGLTEKQLLEWKLPNLDMSNSSDSTNDRDIKLPKIKLWDDFDYNSHAINSSDQDYKIPYISQDKQEFKRELKLQSFIQDILKNIFSNNIYSADEINFGPPDATNKDADNVMTVKTKKGKVKRLIDIEVKNPNVLNALENISLYDFCISSKQKNKKPLYCLKQIYEYMSINSTKYGVLTTYNQTWFLRYEKNNNELFISNTILKNDFLKSMNYLISLTI